MGVQHSSYRQLCWTCKYSCNKHECIWVDTLNKHYKGTELDKDGYIIKCPKYEKDNLLYTTEDKAKSLGITKKRYFAIKASIRNRRLNMTVNEYLERQKEKREKKSKLIIKELYKLYGKGKVIYAYKVIKEQKLKISVQEYLEEHYGVKNEQN